LFESIKMQRKPIFLAIAFILPIVIFVFLKMFGKNEFEIPIFHKDKIEAVAGCDNKYVAPYILPDTIITSVGGNGSEAILILFSGIEKEGKMRLNEKYKPNQLQVVSLSEENAKGMKCAFLLADKFNSVLVDNKRQIRGYYQITTRDEVDRLMVELSILFKEY
jgi:hypothetical protein